MVEWIGVNIELYGLWLVGGMAMFETALIIGLVLPTEPTLIVATAFALQGHFSFGAVAGAAVLGAALGDASEFAPGHSGEGTAEQESADGAGGTLEDAESGPVAETSEHLVDVAA